MINLIKNIKSLFVKDKNLLYLLLIGLAFRFVLLLVFYPHASWFPDSGSYHNLAKKMATGSLEGYTGERSPGYPLLLLFAFGKAGIAVMYQFLLGVLGSLFWYKTLIGFKFTKKESFYVVLFLQSFLNVFFYDTAILVESISLFFVSVLVYFISKPAYAYNQNIKKEFLLSAILGMLVLIKPFFAYLPFLIFGLFVLKRCSFKTYLSRKLILFVFPLLAYFGWSYVNKLNTGYFVSTTFLGLNLSQNCVYFAEDAPEAYQWIAKPYVKHREETIQGKRDVAMSIWIAYGEGQAFESYGLSFIDLSHELGEFAKATIMANPKAYAKQVLTRSWIDFWKPSILWVDSNFRFPWAHKMVANIWSVQKTIFFLLTMLFFLISLIIILKSIYNRKVGVDLLLVCLVFAPSFLQAMVVYGTNSRYSYPFDFIMIFTILFFLKERGIWDKFR